VAWRAINSGSISKKLDSRNRWCGKMEFMDTPIKGGKLKQWKCTQSAMRKAYENIDWDEHEIVTWFGRDLDFLDYPGSKRAHRGARYNGFGPFNPTSQPTYARQWESMPEELKRYINPNDLGYYKDELQREYKPRTEDPDDEEYGEYEIRLPRTAFPIDRTFQDPDFPRNGDTLTLTGKGIIRVAVVVGGVYEVKTSTALVELEILDEQPG